MPHLRGPKSRGETILNFFIVYFQCLNGRTRIVCLGRIIAFATASLSSMSRRMTKVRTIHGRKMLEFKRRRSVKGSNKLFQVSTLVCRDYIYKKNAMQFRPLPIYTKNVKMKKVNLTERDVVFAWQKFSNLRYSAGSEWRDGIIVRKQRWMIEKRLIFYFLRSIRILYAEIWRIRAIG